MVYFEEYTWIFALTVIFAFLTAFGIGANDMANSFATTIGSKALSLGAVVVLAGICEFLGAVLLGSSVTSTIKSGVADLEVFSNTPSLLLYGFMCVSLTTSIWDNLASYLALPVSMTHTSVGATVGMALSLRGGGVVWSRSKDEFPYVTGMVPIFLAWIVSPLMSGIIAVTLYLIIRTFILRSEHGYTRAFYTLPILVGGIFWLIVSFIIVTGVDNGTWDDRGDAFGAWVGAVFGIASALFTLAVIMPLLRRRINAAELHANKLGEQHAGDPEALQLALEAEEANGFMSRMKAKVPNWLSHNPVSNVLLYNIRQDIHAPVETDAHTMAVHAHAEVFDPKTEALFRYLQVFSAAAMSFTHGANDVSNAMGPFSAVYTIWRDGYIEEDVGVDTWILVVGGIGIVLGLALFSYRVISVLGVKVCKMTNARGFCAEMATATTVAIASRYGLPISTTQTITGGLLAVGLTEGLKGVNWRVVLKIFSGWVATLFIACGLAAMFTALGVNSPERRAVDSIQTAAQGYNVTNAAMLSQMYAAAGASPANAAVITTLNALNSSFVEAFAPVQANLNNVVMSNMDIFSTFNTTLAYNPFSQVMGSLAP
jgi:sodium-dependent phosphate transporter